jgi:predicted nucleic acid-binding protein
MYLLDANIWMQLARSRPHAAEVRAFLGAVPYQRLFVTDFAVNSIALNFQRRDQLNELPAFLELSTIGTDIVILRLDVPTIRVVVETALKLGLDYDDAYQYVAAELHGLKLVSLDADFDRTPNGRLTPVAALQLFTDEQSRQQNPQP